MSKPIAIVWQFWTIKNPTQRTKHLFHQKPNFLNLNFLKSCHWELDEVLWELDENLMKISLVVIEKKFSSQDEFNIFFSLWSLRVIRFLLPGIRNVTAKSSSPPSSYMEELMQESAALVTQKIALENEVEVIIVAHLKSSNSQISDAFIKKNVCSKWTLLRMF